MNSKGWLKGSQAARGMVRGWLMKSPVRRALQGNAGAVVRVAPLAVHKGWGWSGDGCELRWFSHERPFYWAKGMVDGWPNVDRWY